MRLFDERISKDEFRYQTQWLLQLKISVVVFTNTTERIFNLNSHHRTCRTPLSHTKLSSYKSLYFVFSLQFSSSYFTKVSPRYKQTFAPFGNTVIPRLTSDPANEDFFAVFWTRLTNMDSANECFSGCAR